MKFNQVLHGVFSVLVIAAMFLASLSIPLTGQVGMISVKGQGTRAASPAEELFFTLLFVFLIILGGEAVRVWVKQAFALDESKFSNAPPTAWGQVGRGLLVKSLVGTSLSVVLGVGLCIAFLFLLVRNIISFHGALPWTFWVVVFVYAGYVAIRRPLFAAARAATKPGTRGGRIVGSALASYHVSDDTIILDLNRKRALPPGKRPFIGLASEPSIVTIRFAELDEARAFTYVEAQAYVQYQLGPDLKIALESVAELYRYLNGEIERPSVYGQWGSMGSVLLLRGPELFYLISVANKDVNDLAAAFIAYRTRTARGVQVTASWTAE
jgi:hypothetical protein